jgi:hypothetical protein
MRLIDADALIKRAAMRGHCLRPLVTAYHMCVDVKDIEKAPTIDAVEVVRCKDCIHDNTTDCPLCWIENHTLQFINHDAEFFCGKGERRDDDA